MPKHGALVLAPPKHDRTEHVPWVGPAPMRSKRKAGSVHSGGETLRQRAQAAGHAQKQRAQAVGDSCHGRVSGINKICFLCSSYCRSQATAA